MINGWDPSIPKEVKVSSDLRRDLEPAARWEVTKELPAPGKDIFLLYHLLSRDECASVIKETENFGYGRTNYLKCYRGNLRLMCTDPGLASALWDRMKGIVPPVVREGGEEWRAIGLNGLFRFSKYGPEDLFEAHVDTFFEESTSKKSMYTVNMYLNTSGEDFEGGCTRFLRLGRIEHCIRPESGMALVFRQPPAEELWHDGDVVRGGYKYLLRTDIMYAKADSFLEDI